MDEHSVDELSDDRVVTTPSASEVVIKGTMIVAGIVGFLGHVRWLESDVVAGYRIGSAAFATVLVMLTIWNIASGQVQDWHSRRLLVIIAGAAAFLSGAVMGPP